MSKDQLFQEGNPSTVQTPQAQQTAEQAGEKKYFEELVGDGKKFTDQESLAKGKAESDAFIEQLKRENEGLRGELNERLAVEKFVDQLSNQTLVQPTPTNTETVQTNQSEVNDSRGEITAEDLSKLVSELVDQKTTEAQKVSNVDRAMQSAKNKYGENYKGELSRKAQELGLGTDFLASIAEQNPSTFNKLMGIDETPQETQTQTQASNETIHTPGSDRVTPDTGSQGTKGYSEFEALRKADPAKYWTPAVQNELMRLTAEQGDAFFQK